MTDYMTALEATWHIWATVSGFFLAAVVLLWWDDRRDMKRRSAELARREQDARDRAERAEQENRAQSQAARAKFLASPANQQQPAEWFRNNWNRPA